MDGGKTKFWRYNIMTFYCKNSTQSTFVNGSLGTDYEQFIYGDKQGVWYRIVLDNWPDLKAVEIPRHNYANCKQLVNNKAWKEVLLEGVTVKRNSTILYEDALHF